MSPSCDVRNNPIECIFINAGGFVLMMDEDDMVNTVKCSTYVKHPKIRCDFKSTISVEMQLRYANWCSGNRSLIRRWNVSCSLTTCSSTFERNYRFHIGLQLLGNVESRVDFFSIGVISAVLKEFRKLPVLGNLLKRTARNGAR